LWRVSSGSRIVRDGETSKTFKLESGSNKVLGFYISGNVTSVTGLKFNISSDAEKSCGIPLIVDVLDDKEADIKFDEATQDYSCTKSYGCYGLSSNAGEDFYVSSTPYCEKIFLNDAPALVMGAWLNKEDASEDVKMSLFDNSGELTSCTISADDITTGEYKCAADYKIEKAGFYYVCVSSQGPGYKIGWETQTPNCGTAEGFGTFNSDFDLFAETTQYSSSPSFASVYRYHDRSLSYHQRKCQARSSFSYSGRPIY